MRFLDKRRLKNYGIMLGSIVIVISLLSVSLQVSEAAPTYNYKIVGSKVYSSTGAVVYTGTNFGKALTWTMGQANKVTYVPAGNYIVSTAIYTAAGVKLIGDGDGPTGTVLNFNDASAAAEQFVVYNKNGVTFSKFRMTGYGSIEVLASRSDVSAITIDHVTAYRCHGNDYAFGLIAFSPYKITGVTFTYCRAEGVDGFGFLLTGNGLKANVKFTDCSANYCGYYSTRFNKWATGFDVCESGSVSNILLTRCTANYNLESGFHMEYYPSASGVLFTNCVASYNGQKPAGFVNGDGTIGPQYAVGFLFNPKKLTSISFDGCSGVGNIKGLSRLAPRATILDTV